MAAKFLMHYTGIIQPARTGTSPILLSMSRVQIAQTEWRRITNRHRPMCTPSSSAGLEPPCLHSSPYLPQHAFQIRPSTTPSGPDIGPGQISDDEWNLRAGKLVQIIIFPFIWLHSGIVCCDRSMPWLSLLTLPSPLFLLILTLYPFSSAKFLSIGRAVYTLRTTLPDFFEAGLVSRVDHDQDLRFQPAPETDAQNERPEAHPAPESIYAPNIRLSYTPPTALSLPSAFPKTLQVEGTKIGPLTSSRYELTLSARSSALSCFGDIY